MRLVRPKPSATKTSCPRARTASRDEPCSETRRKRQPSASPRTWAVVSGRNSAPAATASRTSAASKSNREIAAPSGSASETRRPPAARSNRFRGVAAGSSTRCPNPTRAKTCRPSPLMQPPHTFARGNGLLSTSSVFKPRSAVCRAAQAHRPGPRRSPRRASPSERPRANQPLPGTILPHSRPLATFRCGPRFVQDRAGTSRGVEAHAHVGLHCRSSRHGQRGCKTALSRPLRRATPRISSSENAACTDRGPSTCTTGDRDRIRHPSQASR